MALFSLSDLIATINGRRAMSTKVENTEDSPVPVQLTGSIVTQQTLYERKVRKTNEQILRITPPPRAKGVLVVHYVYGVTGTFNNNQGYRLIVMPIRSTSMIGNPLFYDRKHYFDNIQYSTKITSANYNESVLLSPFDLDDEKIIEGTRYFKVPFLSFLRVEININGTFGDTEGVDSEVIAFWIYD